MLVQFWWNSHRIMLLRAVMSCKGTNHNLLPGRGEIWDSEEWKITPLPPPIPAPPSTCPVVLLKIALHCTWKYCSLLNTPYNVFKTMLRYVYLRYFVGNSPPHEPTMTVLFNNAYPLPISSKLWIIPFARNITLQSTITKAMCLKYVIKMYEKIINVCLKYVMCFSMLALYLNVCSD